MHAATTSTTSSLQFGHFSQHLHRQLFGHHTCHGKTASRGSLGIRFAATSELCQ
jgi:hypothetical protein